MINEKQLKAFLLNWDASYRNCNRTMDEGCGVYSIRQKRTSSIFKASTQCYTVASQVPQVVKIFVIFQILGSGTRKSTKYWIGPTSTGFSQSAKIGEVP